MRVWRSAPRVGTTIELRYRPAYRSFRIGQPTGKVVRCFPTFVEVEDRYGVLHRCKADVYTFRTIKETVKNKPQPLGRHTRQAVLVAKSRLHTLTLQSEREAWAEVLEAEERAAKEESGGSQIA